MNIQAKYTELRKASVGALRIISQLEAERDKLKAELAKAHNDCIQLQQEINCLRMEPCQLPHCEKLKARSDGLEKHMEYYKSRASKLERLCLLYLAHLDPEWIGPEIELLIAKNKKRYLSSALAEGEGESK